MMQVLIRERQERLRGQHWPRTAQHMQRTEKKTIIKKTSKEALARTDRGLHNRDGQCWQFLAQEGTKTRQLEEEGGTWDTRVLCNWKPPGGGQAKWDPQADWNTPDPGFFPERVGSSVCWGYSRSRQYT